MKRMRPRNGTSCLPARPGFSSRGSVLVMVLWILVLISFLASQYVAHNRQKSTIVIHAMERFKRENAAMSLLTLLASDKYEFLKSRAESAEKSDTAGIAGGKSKNSLIPWLRLVVGGTEIFAQVEKESSKTLLAVAEENKIRTTIKEIYDEDEEGSESRADAFADAILDWMDPDDLVRLNGAEKEYYNDRFPTCDPGNGPFKSISQIFLLKGFEPLMFWGDSDEYLSRMSWLEGNAPEENRLLGDLLEKKEESEEGESDGTKTRSILDAFTVYPKEYIRISMLFPEERGKYYNEIFFVKKEGLYFKIVEQLSRVFTVQNREDES